MGFLGFFGWAFYCQPYNKGAHLGDQPGGPARLQHLAHDARRTRALQLHSRERCLQGTAVQWVGGGGVCLISLMLRIRRLSGDPGLVKIRIRDSDPGWTTRIIIPRDYKQCFGLKYLNSLMRIGDGKNSDSGAGIRDGKNSYLTYHQFRPCL